MNGCNPGQTLVPTACSRACFWCILHTKLCLHARFSAASCLSAVHAAALQPAWRWHVTCDLPAFPSASARKP